jgi:hypothetical protein
VPAGFEVRATTNVPFIATCSSQWNAYVPAGSGPTWYVMSVPWKARSPTKSPGGSGSSDMWTLWLPCEDVSGQTKGVVKAGDCVKLVLNLTGQTALFQITK